MCIDNYQNDLQEGKQIQYYENGSIESICEYIAGIINGKYIEYWQNKNIRCEYNYVDGNIISEQCFYENKNKEFEIIYYSTEVISQKYWDIDGNEIEKPKIREINLAEEKEKEFKVEIVPKML